MSNRLLKRVDIEKLLQWAFRHELPKRSVERGGFGSSISPMFRLAALGTRVDDWSEEPGFPRALGEPEPDALLIEEAVLAFEQAAEVDSRGGVVIDWRETRRTAIGALGGLLTDDEPTLKYLTIGIPGLVAMHAKMGTRPPWGPEPRPEPIILNNGKARVQYEDENGKLIEGRKNGNYGAMSRCPLRWWPEPRVVAFNRIEYSIWWQALDTLADYLDGKLSGHVALPPAAHPSPWTSRAACEDFLNHV